MRIHTFTEDLDDIGVTLYHQAHLVISEGTVFLMLILDGIHGENIYTKAISNNPKYVAWLENPRDVSFEYRFKYYKLWFRSPDHVDSKTKYHNELKQHIHEMYNDNK